MGFWGNLYEGFQEFVDVASAVGNSIIKATKATIDFVYDTTVQVAGRIAEAARLALRSIGKDIETVIDVTGDIIKKTISKSFEILKQIKDSFNDLFSSSTTNSSKNSLSIDQIFMTVRGLLYKAEEVKTRPDMQNFEDFARLKVSVMFLEDLLTKEGFVESVQKVNTRFLAYIGMFFENKFNGDKTMIADFNNQIKQIYKKDLLVIGSEILIDFWSKQENELKALFSQLIMDINEAEANVTKYETRVKNKVEGYELLKEQIIVEQNKIANWRKEKDKIYAQYIDNKDMAGVSRSMLFLMMNKDKQKESLVNRGKDTGTILVNWQNDKQPTNEEREEIRKFNLIVQGEINKNRPNQNQV